MGCESAPKVLKEPWVDKPVNEWPTIDLTNDVSFSDTLIRQLGNSFLVNTGKGNIGVSCKHLFVIFENPPYLTTIDLGPNFDFWNMYPKNKPDLVIPVNRLISANPMELIGYYNTLKDRDWIILELGEKNPGIYPLRIRFRPVEKYEVDYHK